MTAARSGGTGVGEQRRHRLRLDISRQASRLFWEHGVAATTGDRIAEAVGLSTRTVWRHFRSKESCAEPIVLQGVEWELRALRSWPRPLSLEEHLTAEVMRYENAADAAEQADTLLAVRMIRLADREPSIRTAWLMAGDQVEYELTAVVARRLGRRADDLEVRLYGAAASAALRVVNEELGAGAVRGVTAREFQGDVIRGVARAVREATGGTIGDAIGDVAGAAPGDVSGEAPGDVSGAAHGNVTGAAHGDESGEMLGDASGESLGDASDEALRDVSGGTAMGVSGDAPGP